MTSGNPGEGYKSWISSIKGWACLFIFVGHFFYGLSYTSSWANIVYSHIFPFLLNGTFAVALFCFISGYFTTDKIKTLWQLIIAIIKRYLRLCLPLFAVCLFIYLFNLLFSYSAGSIQITSVIENDWLQSGITDAIRFFDVIFQPFIGILILRTNKFALPTWMLFPMFFSQIFLMVYNFFLSKILREKTIKYRWDLLVLSGLFSLVNYTFGAVLLGYWYKTIEKSFTKKTGKNRIYVLIGIMIFAHILQFFFRGINERVFADINVLIVLILFHEINMSEKKYPDGFIGRKLGEISFPVYLLHMPVIHVFSCFVIVHLVKLIPSYDIVLIITLLLSAIMVYILSRIWEYIITPVLNKSTAIIISMLSRLS